MAEIIKSIKASGGDYSNIADWIADLDNTGIYSSGDTAIGELYSETYTDSLDFSGVTPVSGMTKIILRPHTGSECDGIINNGARIQSNGAYIMQDGGGTDTPKEIYDIEIDFNGKNLQSHNFNCKDSNITLGRMMFHNIRANRSVTPNVIGEDSGGGDLRLRIFDCLIFDCSNIGSGGIVGIYTTTSVPIADIEIYNNTITDLSTSGNGNVTGIVFGDDSDYIVKNNLVSNLSTTGAGSTYCYNQSSPVSATTATNAGDDATSPDGASYRNLTVVYTDAGNDDYTINTGSSSENVWKNATDLGDIDVAIDIAQRNRHDEGDNWGTGCFQYISPYAAEATRVVGRGVARGVGVGIAQ